MASNDEVERQVNILFSYYDHNELLILYYGKTNVGIERVER